MFYLIENINSFTKKDYEAIYIKMPDIIKSKVNQKALLENQKQTLIGYYLLSQILAINYQIITFPEIAFTEFGKPYFVSLSLYFNISHSNNLVACAVSDEKIGIDIEIITPKKEELYRFVCNEIEYQVIARSSDPDFEFTKFWTKKESYLKYHGKGIGTNLKELLTNLPENRFLSKKIELLNNESYVLTIYQENNQKKAPNCF